MMNPIITVGIIVVISIVGLYFLYGWFRPRRKSNIKDLYSEGLDMLITGYRKGAYQNFKTIIRKDTNNVKAYIKLGQVTREGGNPEQALKIHKSLTLRKKISAYEQLELLKNLALDYYELNDLPSAIDQSLKIVNNEKKNEWALSHLIKFYRENNDWKKAGEYLVKYQKVTETSDSHKIGLYKIQEGRCSINDGDFSKARNLFEEALKIDDKLHIVYYFLGNSYSAESEEVYRQASEIDEKSTQTATEKELYQDLIGKTKVLLSKCVPHWARLAELNPEQAWLVIPKLKDALFALERFHEIEDVLRQVLRKDPNNINALASLADFYDHRGDVMEATELIQSACEKDENSILAKLIRFKFKVKREDKRNLSAELEKIIQSISSDQNLLRMFYKTSNDLKWLEETGKDMEMFSI
ncbi:MAG: hypothetical protein ISR90_02555 [Candidatus Marinimicrobia bacterium]|nr:hypothetical protein [Candidatus Neomarinimicrobiota bacterium]MBL7022921.1 hypothetical protein [Candidatus Neomarinimicrobiota bacterium]MBL7110124.1 hypothetical protein [Candidatus Neomarinimicrobiota bacterium]